MGPQNLSQDVASEAVQKYESIRNTSFQTWDKIYAEKKAAARRKRETEETDGDHLPVTLSRLPNEPEAISIAAAVVPAIASTPGLIDVTATIKQESPDLLLQSQVARKDSGFSSPEPITHGQPRRQLVRRTIYDRVVLDPPADFNDTVVVSGPHTQQSVGTDLVESEATALAERVRPSENGPNKQTRDLSSLKTFKRRVAASSTNNDRSGNALKKARSDAQTTYPNSDPGEIRQTSGYQAVEEFGPPKWYTDLKRDNSRARDEGDADVLLSRIKSQIEKCKSNKFGHNPNAAQSSFSDLREMLHQIAFIKVSAKLLRKNRMLESEYGLPEIFHQSGNSAVDWPWDVKADAEELYNRWCQRIFDNDLLRGIIVGKPKALRKPSDTSSHDTATDESSYGRLDKDYPGLVSANYFGNGDLLNGQWWPSHLTLLRDGAHGASQAGIWGKEGEGAYSCIVAGGLDSDGREYPDEDYGDWVWYCGTDGKDGNIAWGTQRMIESVDGHLVRVFRSHKSESRYAPQLGIRYDGLYDVVQKENIDGATSLRQRHRFKLVRVDGQAPLRAGDGPERRPTAQEIEAFRRDKTLMRVH